MTAHTHLIVRQLGRQPYFPIWQAMQDFTDTRGENTSDELWLVEHEPVFTQGQAGKEEHLLAPGDIPVVKVDRGGQVTYHGPGQQMLYVLLNLKRNKLGVRDLVTALEKCVVNSLQTYNIDAYPKADAPGVYVDGKKICSIGLRIRKGCSFHGLALNVNMELSPFLRINPCGYAGLEMINCAQLHGPANLADAGKLIVESLCELLGLNRPDSPTLIEYREGFDE
ncbi:lipoyl(octanoyl) transferase LipB [Paraglaciecola hydrolytica]|uniref:Octanoyltransferase n=1 Tax=Paraglaciecola hydrolytica TaxID=1799789 RepID=A0A136A5T3_9ALTE|nr:lipoyl(octanoyl) transferase LipB [Paraglaciecola hydrolytica]KXI30583.1 octanoyltransferase [Paraglaciecola hydrolytica]